MADKRLGLLKKANKLFRQGKTEAAVKEYKKILAIKSDDLEVRRIIGDLELRQNNTDEAVEQFGWIADYYLKEGFFAKAIAMYKRITRVDPTCEKALFKLADLYTKQGLIMEAKQIYLDVAEECKRQNNQKKALEMYKKILEFDRGNIKMRTLLADNFLKEGLEDNAIEEYKIAADILAHKKDYRHLEELLINVLKKVKNVVMIDKLVNCYITQNQSDKAIALLKEMTPQLSGNVDLLKTLGELYLKQNLINEAEEIFVKIAEVDPEETEVIMRLGKVYLQREQFDKTFEIFIPIVDKNIKANKFEEAASLLRFIIASNNMYLPALIKLAELFKISGKRNNLIALYESLIPVYQKEGMKEELKKILEELIQMSDNPYSYEEQLEKLSGESQRQEVEEAEDERETEFVNYNLRIVEEALNSSEFDNAITTLIKAKTTFPNNIIIRLKLFEVYQTRDHIPEALDEGKELLDLYKSLGMEDEHSQLFDILAHLNPEDEKLLEISGDEKTSIDIDFQRDELVEELEAIGGDDEVVYDENPEEEELLLLSPEQSVPGSVPMPELVPEPELDTASAASEPELATSPAIAPMPHPGIELGVEPTSYKDEYSKSLSTYLSELDFYINERYFNDAEKLVQGLKQKYPEDKDLHLRTERLKKTKAAEAPSTPAEPAIATPAVPTPAPPPSAPPTPSAPVEESLHEHTEPILQPEATDLVLETASGEVISGVGYEQSDVHIELDSPEALEPMEPMELNLSDEEFAPLPLTPDPPPVSAEVEMPFVEVAEAQSGTHEIEMPELDDEPLQLDLSEPTESPFEIERSIAEESHDVQEFEDSKVGLKVEDLKLQKEEKSIKPEPAEMDGLEFEIEFDEPKTGEVPIVEVDQDILVQSPSAPPPKKESREDSKSGGSIDELDLSDVMMDDSSSNYDMDSPFKEITGTDLGFDTDEELLADEALFIEEAYFETEKLTEVELESISFWLKEVEKQRTSTIEKNMMEIFDEFKKGVDEKIGQEDYDTRYNLGIAYKEMGLLEEAIHEFLISSKHPLKLFDSAGLLGMCFREKGMFSEATNWFEKALFVKDRKKEEYLAVKFELVMTYKLNEDFEAAMKCAEEIQQADPGYRNISELYKEIQGHITA